MKKLGALVILFSLVGCGGSQNVTEFRVTKVFSDGAGVFTSTSKNGNKGVGMAPEISSFVKTMKDPEDTSNDIVYSDFPIVRTYSHGNIRSGALSDGNISANVTVFEDNSEDAGVVYMEIPGVANVVMAEVGPYTAPTGPFSYSGLFSAADRTYSTSMEYGTFTMSADFSANTVAFDGQTSSYSLTGNAVLDSDAGTFNSTTFRFEDGYYYYDASIYGLMGGSGAKATSGVFHTNDRSVDYAGAFIGHR